jgi:hypothetical protein
MAQPMPGVASAGAQGALRAQRVGGPLEYGAGVVIESANQVRLDMILDAGAAQVRTQRLEMRPRLRIQRIEQSRGAGDDALHGWVLAVEYPQRVALEPPPAVFVERSLVRTEIGRELLAIHGARGGSSQ